MLPAFVLQLDVLERDGVPARIQVRQCLVFRHPAPMDDIPMHRLSFLVQQLDPDLLPEILDCGGGLPAPGDYANPGTWLVGTAMPRFIVPSATLRRTRQVPV